MNKKKNQGKEQKLTLKIFFESIDYQWIRQISVAISDFKRTPNHSDKEIDDRINKPYSHTWEIEDTAETIDRLARYMREKFAVWGITEKSFSITITDLADQGG